MISLSIKIKDTDVYTEIKIHQLNCNSIIINVPGYGGSIDGYDNKYEKLSEYIINEKLSAIIQMENPALPKAVYGITLIKSIESVIEYAIENSIEICGNKTPDIYLIGMSAGGGAIAIIAHKYSQVKKLLFMCPANGNVFSVGDANMEIKLFTGEIYIVTGENDEVISPKYVKEFAISALNGDASKVEFIIIPDCNHHFTGEKNGRILSRAPFWAFGTDIIFPRIENSCKLYDDIIAE